MKIGIVGYSFCGKSTVFDALIKEYGDARYGGLSVRVGVSNIPDHRLKSLATIFNPKKVSFAKMEFVDLPSISEKGISGELLGAIQKLDALVLVVRAFKDESVPHPFSKVDVKSDIQKLLFDIAFQDINILSNRIERLRKDTKGLTVSERSAVEARCKAIEEVEKGLEEGVFVSDQKLSSTTSGAISDSFLITKLPILVALNTGESEEDITLLEKGLLKEGISIPITAMSAKLEAELSELSLEEQVELRDSFGVKESGFSKVVGKAYETAGLISFLTVGSDEVRAWSIKKDSLALDAAGAIHSDIRRGFIRAEVVAYDDFMEVKDMTKARSLGLVRQEGKAYVFKDGDIVNFLFSK